MTHRGLSGIMKYVKKLFFATLISVVYDHTAHLNCAQDIFGYTVGSSNAKFADFLSLLMLRLSTEILVPGMNKD